MKILKVLGLVVGLHVLAYLVIMSPGCRSTSARPEAGPAATAAAPAAPAVAVSEPNPAAGVQPISLTLPLAQTAGERFAPTRPGTAAADVVPAKTYTIQKGDTLATVARKNGLTARELAAANNIAHGAPLHIGQKLVIPAKAAKSTAAGASPASAAPSASAGTYTVKSGDTLSKIASRHGTTTAALRSINGISGDMLRVGQVLQLPGDAKSAPAATTSSAPSAPLVSPAPASAGPAPATGGGPNGGIHTVNMGETAESIARKYHITIIELARANNITDPHKIRIGQKLVIPSTAAMPAAPPTPSLVPDSSAQPVAPQRGQDLDAGLPATEDAPLIKVEEPPPVVPAK